MLVDDAMTVVGLVSEWRQACSVHWIHGYLQLQDLDDCLIQLDLTENVNIWVSQ